MPLDLNRIAATATGYVSDGHTYVKGIETAYVGKIYTKTFDGLNYVVDTVAKPALQKVAELDYTKRAVDTILKNKNISIAVGAFVVVISIVLFMVWLHPSSKPSGIEGKGESKAPGKVDETGEIDEIEELEGEEEIEESEEEEEVDDDDSDEVEKEGENYAKPPNLGLVQIGESNNVGGGANPFDLLITPETSSPKILYLDEQGNHIGVNDEEGDVDLDGDQWEKQWLNPRSTTTKADNRFAQWSPQRNRQLLTINKNAPVSPTAISSSSASVNTFSQGSLDDILTEVNTEFVLQEKLTTTTNLGNNLDEKKDANRNHIVKGKEHNGVKNADKVLENKPEKKPPSADVHEQQVQADNAEKKEQTQQQQQKPNVDESFLIHTDSDHEVDSDGEEESDQEYEKGAQILVNGGVSEKGAGSTATTNNHGEKESDQEYEESVEILANGGVPEKETDSTATTNNQS